VRQSLHLVVAQAAAMHDVGDRHERGPGALFLNTLSGRRAQAGDVPQAETEG
jgi:hypothetical protein